MFSILPNILTELVFGFIILIFHGEFYLCLRSFQINQSFQVLFFFLLPFFEDLQDIFICTLYTLLVKYFLFKQFINDFARMLSLWSHPTLCDPMGCSPFQAPLSVPGILQARILEWVAISSSKGSSQPRDQIHFSYVSCIGRRIVYHQCHPGSPKHLIFPDSLPSKY